MPTLRLRLIGLFVALALAVAGVMILAVDRFSSEQIMKMAIASGSSPTEAQAMFDAYVARILFIGAGAGVVLGALAAWWLLRRILMPLERLADATRAIASGDLAARVPNPPDPELRGLSRSSTSLRVGPVASERRRAPRSTSRAWCTAPWQSPRRSWPVVGSRCESKTLHPCRICSPNRTLSVRS